MTIPRPFQIADREQVKKRVEELSARSSDIKSRVAVTLREEWRKNGP